MEARVFLIQQPTPRYRKDGSAYMFDLSSADRYGKIVPVLSSQDQPSVTPGPSVRLIENKLSDYVPGKDYILVVGGDPYGTLMTGSVLRHLFPGKRHNLLRYERDRTVDGKRRSGAGFYVPVTVEL